MRSWVVSIFSRLFGKDQAPQFTPDDPNLPFVQAPSGESAIVLEQLDLQLKLSGLFSETTQTMRFYNPNKRELEGALSIPLPDDAQVCGYAIDIDGELVEGVIVGRQTARQVLEAEERKNADPGLLEKVQGNIYRARIYPLPPKGHRTVRITTVSELTQEADLARFTLPLAHTKHVDKTTLSIEVLQSPVAPHSQGLDLSWTEHAGGWRAATKASSGGLADLELQLPGLPPSFCAIEKDEDGDRYFLVSAKREPSCESPLSLQRLGVAWDVSGSRAGAVEKDLSMLEQLLEGLQGVEVTLVPFSDVPWPPETFTDPHALLQRLRSLPYDGATALSALEFSDDSLDAWLIFSDGLQTSRVAPQLPAACPPLFTISSASHNDSALMRYLATQTGGTYLDLRRSAPEEAAQSVLQHRTRPTIDAPGCEAISIRVTADRLAILGKLQGTRAELRIDGLTRIALEREQATPGRLVPRAWASTEANRLGLWPEENQEALLALGRRFGLVTAGSSLLVLETLEQHLEHRIMPPTSRPKLREAYQRQLGDQEQQERERRLKHVESILSLWNERVQWWEKDFRPQWPDPNAPAKPDLSQMREEMAPGAPMQASAPMPAMDAMPMASIAASGAMDFEDDCEESLAEPEASASKDKSEPSKGASIAIQPWSPDTPYLKAMKSAPQAYQAYLSQRPEYAQSPSFYLDCGDYLLQNQERPLGLRVLSNLLELGLDDPPLMRMYAWRLQQAGALDEAVSTFERVLALRDDEPQSYRDLALALSERYDRDRDPDDAVRGAWLLYEVIVRAWDRFPEIELIALMELNRLIHRAPQAPLPTHIDPRLVKLLDLDIRISMSWDADLTDVDLHVFEPTGEHAYYGHNQTEIGGMVSRDFTQGYGPEEYVLRRAYPGEYTVKAHYYGSSQQDLVGPCTVIVNAFLNYGRDDEQKQVLTLRLDKPSDQVLVGKIKFEK